jgi:TetR/AcrR family transcriptional regulator, transcriptional repressor for nem operon
MTWTASTPAHAEHKLAAYFSLYRKGLDAGHGVCPAGALAPGWDCIDDDLREAVRGLREVQVLWLSDVLTALDGIDRGRSVRETAAFIFAACQGALLSARMTAAIDDFDNTIAHTRDTVLRDSVLRDPIVRRTL